MGDSEKKAETKEVLLVADRRGQRMGEVYDKHRKANAKRPVKVNVGESFTQSCPVIDGEVKIPRWCHIPDADERKAIEIAKLKAHKKAGDERAIKK